MDGAVDRRVAHRAPHDFEHREVLDPLRDDLGLHLVRDRDDAGQDAASALAAHRADDHVAIDLDVVHRELAQHFQARVAGAGVVEGQPKSELPQPRRFADDHLHACDRPFRDLQHDAVRDQARGFDLADERGTGELAVVERLRADVEKEQRVGGERLGFREDRRAAHAVELVRAPDPFRDVERVLRVDGILTAGARECLVPDQRTAFDAPDRLKRNADRRSRDQPAHLGHAGRREHRMDVPDLVERHDRITAAPLRLVERGVGLFAHHEHVGPVRRRRRDPDADGRPS